MTPPEEDSGELAPGFLQTSPHASFPFDLLCVLSLKSILALGGSLCRVLCVLQQTIEPRVGLGDPQETFPPACIYAQVIHLSK